MLARPKGNGAVPIDSAPPLTGLRGRRTKVNAMKRGTIGLLFVMALVAIAAPLPRSQRAQAQTGPVTLKIATLFPANSSLFRTLQAWGQSVREHTSNQVTIEFVSKGRTGSEREIVAGIQSGTYDGAVLTASGLKVAAPGALVLGAPGVVTEYERLDRARRSMESDLNGIFTAAGYHHLGWADYGQARIFSTTALPRPTFSGRKLWASGDDAIASAVASATGATAVDAPVSRVAAQIDAHAIDTIYASPVAVVSLNWHSETRMRFVSQQSFGIIVGATVLKTASYNRIPAAHRAAFDRDAAAAHVTLNRAIRRDDGRNYDTAIQRGVTAVDTNAARGEWDQAFGRARSTLSGRTFPAALLTRLQAIR